MNMNPTIYALIAIAIMSAVTIFTRALPFVIFGRNKRPPKIIIYLGAVLPPAIIAMLVVYCLKDMSLFSWSWPYGIPELISVAAVILLHIWKRNNLISIFGGTAIYMILIQLVFN